MATVKSNASLRRTALLVVPVCLLMLAEPGAALNPQTLGEPQESASASVPEVVQIRRHIYLLAGAGGNIVVSVGGDGVVLVDSGAASYTPAVAAAIRRLSPLPVRFIFNTSADPDHVGGNETFLRASQKAFESIANLFPRNYFVSGPIAILATEGVLRRMSAPSGQTSPYPVEAWPTETLETGRRYVYLNDDGIEVIHQPAAHTDGDATVFFRKSDVLVVGDIMDMTRFPVIDRSRGGSLQGLISALNRLVATAIPSVPDVSRDVGTTVVPGHGHIGDQFDLLNYRDMLVIVRDHVQDLIKQGRTLEQIKSANPARGFVNRYGSATGPWTTADFIEAVYNSLVGRT